MKRLETNMSVLTSNRTQEDQTGQCLQGTSERSRWLSESGGLKNGRGSENEEGGKKSK